MRRRPLQQPGEDGGSEPTFQLTQKGFAAGVVDPQALGRSDNVKYALGLRQCRNAWIEKHGCVEKRPGTRYGNQQTSMAAPIRLRPFNYDAYQGYALEIGAGYIVPWAQGQPLSAIGASNFSLSTPVPFGTFVQYPAASGHYWWCAAEQFNLPIQMTVTGTYTAGGVVTLTTSATFFTNVMCWTGAQVLLRVPGGTQIVVTLSVYTSGTQASGTVDSAVPAALQATATVLWACTYKTYGITYLGSVSVPSAPAAITLTITGGSYAAGATLGLAANVGFFSAEMVSQGTIISLPTSLGVIQLKVTGYTSDVSAAGVANLAIPVALQAAATPQFSIPISASQVTVSPLGPTWAPDVQFPGGSPTISVAAASTSFAAGASLTLTASSDVFVAGMGAAAQGILFYDGLGNSWACTITLDGGPTSVTATSLTAVPQWLQNQPVVYWTMTTVVPAAGAFWYQLPTTRLQMPFAAPQGSLATLQSEQNVALLTATSQQFFPCELLRLGPYQWQLRPLLLSAGIAAPTGVLAQIGYGPPDSGHPTLHTFGYVVTAVDANGNESLPSNPAICVGNYPSFTLPNIITWTPVPGAISYNVYQTGNSVPAAVVSSQYPSANDVGSTPNISIQPPALIPLFQTPNDYPAGVAFYQQRRAFFNTINLPQTFWMSQPNYPANYTVETPINASSAVQCNLASRVIAAITALADLGKLVVHTASAEYICTGDITGTITDTTIGLIRQGTHGSALIPPVVLGNTDLFTQARGNQVRDMRYDIRSTTYQGKDVTQFATELFRGRAVVDMVWQSIPNSVIWFLMDNGQLYGLTYIYEEDIWAWHEHDMNGNGFIESICVIPENDFDTLYMSVNRTINGATVRYIERLATSMWADMVNLSDAVYCDCALTIDGREPNGDTVVVTTGGGWTPTDLLTITCSAPMFFAGDTGGKSAVVLQQYDTSGQLIAEITIPIAVYISVTVAQGYPDQPVPAWAQSPNVITTWGKAVSYFTIPHLIGQTVSLLGDGGVFAPQVVPSNGIIATQFPVLVLTAGLATITQLETLPVENSQGETLTTKQILIVELEAMFYLSRGGLYGQDFAHLKAWNQRLIDLAEPFGTPTTLYTGPATIGVQGTWEKTGQLCIEHDDPLPFGISALTPVGFAGN